jgi:hypothetical protein
MKKTHSKILDVAISLLKNSQAALIRLGVGCFINNLCFPVDLAGAACNL